MPGQNKFSLGNFVFNISLLIALMVVGAFFYLQYEIGKKNAELDSLSVQAIQTKTDEQKKTENKIFSAQQKLDDLSIALDEHRANTIFFTTLETLVHPEVYFTACELDAKQSAVALDGQAKTFQGLGQQIDKLASAKDIIKSVKVDKVGIDNKGNIIFSVALDIEPEAVAFK